MSIVACIPAYNEEKSIGLIVRKTLFHVDKVIVCDDGSIDNTAMEAKSSGAYVIKHDKNKGKGAALKTLFQYVLQKDADVIVTIDGDGQFLPEEIPILTTPILENKSDLVLGYRFDSNSQMPRYRKIGNRVLDKMTNLASELPFRDTQSGFRAYSRKAIEEISFSTTGFGVDGEILINASKKDLRISEEKISVLYDTGYKTSTKNPISHSGEVVSSLVEQIAVMHPLKFLGLPGVILIGIGIFFSVLVLGMFNETRYFSIPSTLVALGTFIIGIMLLLMSILLFSISLHRNRSY